MAGAAKAGLLMTEGSQYPAALHSTAVGGELPARMTFTDGSGLLLGCSTATMNGTLGWARSTPGLHPEFSGCRALNSVSGATITTTGCDFRLHIGGKVGETGRYDGTVGIECETGKAITVVSHTCEIQIDSQSARGTIEMSNVAGSPGDISVTWNVTGLVYTVVKDGFFCEMSGVGVKEDGDFTSTSTLTAKATGGEAIGLTVEEG